MSHNIFKPTLIKRLVFLSVIVFFISSCGEDYETSVDFSDWPDTTVVEKYSGGEIKKIIGYKKGDTSIYYQWLYYEKGNLWIEGPSKGTKRHGDWKAYNEEGKLISIGTFENDVKTGKKIVWHDNGQKYYEGQLDSGERVGLWKFYNMKGDLIKEIDYSNGKKSKK